jgi:exopolysaccharide production protein ExoZ
VDVFFALSGYIIYGLLIEKPVRFLPFARRRVVRLYPVFTFALAVYFVADLIWLPMKPLPDSFVAAILYVGANFLMLPGLLPIVPLMDVAWSLSYELFFYLTAPLISAAERLARLSNRTTVWVYVIVCAAYLCLTVLHVGAHARMVMFGCGILARRTLRYECPFDERLGNTAALVLFAVVLAINGLRADATWSRYCSPVLTNAGSLLACLFAATYALLYFGLRGNGLVASVFS